MAFMKTGDITASIGLTITRELLEELGFKPAPDAPAGRATWWREEDYPAMCDKIGDWVKARKSVRKAAPAPAPKPASAPASPPPPAASSDDDEL